jgi:hypothetical protein
MRSARSGRHTPCTLLPRPGCCWVRRKQQSSWSRGRCHRSPDCCSAIPLITTSPQVRPNLQGPHTAHGTANNHLRLKHSDTCTMQIPTYKPAAWQIMLLITEWFSQSSRVEIQIFHSSAGSWQALLRGKAVCLQVLPLSRKYTAFGIESAGNRTDRSPLLDSRVKGAFLSQVPFIAIAMAL